MAQIIEMPKLSDTMETGTLVKWLKKEGEQVEPGDMLAEVETDKATMELENFEDGVLLKLYVEEGDEVPIGAPVCAVGEKGEEAPPAPDSGAPKKEEEATEEDRTEETAEPQEEGEEARPSAEEEPAEVSKQEPEAPEEEREEDKTEVREERAEMAPAGEGEERIKASPLARRIASEKGVSLRDVEGSGPGGRIVKEDVLKAAESAPAKAPSPAKAPGDKPSTAPAEKAARFEPLADKELKVTNMRKSIAKALVASKTQAPHFYLQSEVDSLALGKLRQDLNNRLSELPAEQGGIKFSVNDLILKAAIEAVRRVPAINRSWHDTKIVQHGSVHLAFGVAVDDGLLTPVIRNADQKSLREISTEAKELIKKARGKKLKPEEMQGSTLTVTNLGMYGITDFYGIINPPNAAILSVGATIKQPVVDDDDNITIGHRMKVGLSGDHRVIDGAVGAEYLAALRTILETPAVMLV